LVVFLAVVVQIPKFLNNSMKNNPIATVNPRQPITLADFTREVQWASTGQARTKGPARYL
jgi:hypothetical protein